MLDELEEVQICVGYRLDGREIDLLPLGADRLASCEPIYESMPGWQAATYGVTRHEDLPAAARDYVERLQTLVGVPIDLISTGPDRDQTILRRHPFEIVQAH